MSSQNRRGKASQVAKISDVLNELYYTGEFEKPQERIAAYRELIPKILDFARRTEDRKLIEIVEQFAAFEEQSRSFYEIEILQQKLGDLRGSLERIFQSISPEAVNTFLACINEFESTLVDAHKLALSSVQRFTAVREQLAHELIGRRLEKEIAPDLAKQLGYTPGPNILADDGGEVEVDFLGEKNSTTSVFGTGRLKKKAILIIESKTTITQSDIVRFSKKLAIIRDKYEKNAQNFRCDLEIAAWIFACYGWTEELRKLAKGSNIKPFGKEEIVEALRENNLLDRRIPICP